MTKTIRVAAAQTKSLSTVQETLASLETIAKSAQQQCVGLVLFPEAYLGGYPRTCTFASSIGSRQDHGRRQFQHYFAAAVDLGDTVEGAGAAWHERQLPVPAGARWRGDGTREQLERIAAATGVFLAVGLIERAGASLFCGLVYVSPEAGMLREKRRKVMPTGTERLVWAQGSAATLRAVTATVQGVQVTIGTGICWENYMPLLRYSLYAQNVNVYLAPTADGRDNWLPLMRTVASEGRAFVLSCNQVVRQSELPDWVKPEGDGSSAASIDRQESRASESPRALGRRQSIISRIDDGHEICWPCDSNGSQANAETTADVSETHKSASPSPSRLRRKSSVFSTTGGHKICFPIPETAPIKTDIETRTAAAASSDEPARNGTHTSTDPPSQDPFVSRGGSCIISPFGTVLQEPVWESEGLVIADIDVDECIRGKYDFDVAGHYSRSDAFKLSVTGLDLAPP